MISYPHYVMRRTWDFFGNGDLRCEYIGNHALTAHSAYARTFPDLTAAKEATDAPGFRPVLRVMADLAAPCPNCGGTRIVCETGFFWAERLPCLHCATLTPEPGL